MVLGALILVTCLINLVTLGSREYRTPPAVAPPQVPSHYAPNYPIGHPRRGGERGPGYSTLPMGPNPHQAVSPPQVGMVHPLNSQQQHPQTPPPPPPPVNTSYLPDHHMSMPRMLKYSKFKILLLIYLTSFSTAISIGEYTRNKFT